MAPYIDTNWTELTADEQDALDYWKTIVEGVLATGQPCCTELNFWLKPMGFKYTTSLALPWKSISPIWSYIGLYFLAWSYEYCGIRAIDDGGFPSLSGIGRVDPICRSTSRDLSGITALLAAYPKRRGYIELLNSLYNRVYSALQADETYLRAHVTGFNIEHIIAGLLILFDLFLARTAWRSGDYGYHYFYLPSADITENFDWANGTVGPYTVSVYFCENGVIRKVNFHLPLPEYSVCHQSVDCEILLQDEEQTELSADILVGYRHTEDLDADIIVYGGTASPLDADVALQGDVQTPLRSSICLEDKTEYPLPADGLLAADHQFPLGAHIAVAYGRYPLDADICVQSPTLLSLAASMYVEPDFESEELTRLERAHIQKFRITADPRKYEVFNSETDTEVVP
jgi:hypothetical protein